MIAVMADDLTGAAELAGAAADMGFLAEVQTTFDPASTAEVICIDTDTRRLESQDAAAVVAKFTQDILQSRPKWIFKKTDSVLRGNVRAEIESILRTAAMCHALLVPANPSKGRAIRGGIYYVNGTLLHDTAFAIDPDHPRLTSVVGELLGQTDVIAIPDASSREDLQRHATNIDHSSLAAGGVDFFRSLLGVREGVNKATEHSFVIRPPVLMVCGSLHSWQGGREDELKQAGVPIVFAGDPTAIERDPSVTYSCVALAIGVDAPAHPEVLTARLATAVFDMTKQLGAATLCIEGGATAAAVVKRFGFNRLAARPSKGWEGVAVLNPVSAQGMTILMKPGSYPWPPKFWAALKTPE